MDPTPQHLAQLDPAIRARAEWLVAILRYYGVPVKITSSRRTVAEQARLVAAGRSRTLSSRHIEGKAFDIDIQGWHRDAIPREFWPVVGEIGEALGLTWGGRWRNPYDPGHFQV